MNAKRRYQKRSRRTRQKRDWMPVTLLIVGLLALGWGVAAYLTAPTTASASTSYLLDDVARDRPIHAVHEMGEGPAILFLPRKQAQPDIQVPERFYNFGTIGPQDIVEREFIIRNIGEAPLTISRAYTTCGCTTADISASVIPPGKVATIRLIFDAGFHDTAGQTVRRGLIIENNDRDQSQAEIWIEATVRES